MDSFPHIVVGCYEEFVLGYNAQFEDETFATHSHQASLRCVAAHEHMMASSGADEYINIYDMVEMEVSTVINYHNSTVTCLEFTPDGSHLVTANQNGDIAIFRCRDWTLVKLWKQAHKHANGVTSISIHPSGSLLLTTGADNIVRFWNLVKGRQAYATNFSKKVSVGNSLNFGMWSKNGIYYAVCIGVTLEIYKTKTAAIVYEIKANSRVTSCTFTKKNLICLATEDGSLEIHSIKGKQLLLKKQAHKTRIKSLSSFELKVLKNDKYIIKNYIVSVDSKGEINLWQLKKKGANYSLQIRGKADCGCRITCLTVVSSKAVKKEKNDVPEVVSLQKVTQETVTELKLPDEQLNGVNAEKQNLSFNTKTKNSKRKMTESDTSPVESKKTKEFKNGITTEQNSADGKFEPKTKRVDFKKKGKKDLGPASKAVEKFNKKKFPITEIPKKKRKKIS